ncbi:hypothetical protein BU23DRAFT_601204 [Bimuria novae-zelandiae CBS 107.79]|uniref:Uncharacterized protein n=1 Tax=Bimuria novae-zelandiae CBS 107.79 TaxID=1447943 RepID=A0A6A5V9T8_9PLEO|nr:hypothetical protein BU23DRAFT_601204 [Bimuria novae-zelandiae CBS 107.79]
MEDIDGVEAMDGVEAVEEVGIPEERGYTIRECHAKRGATANMQRKLPTELHDKIYGFLDDGQSVDTYRLNLHYSSLEGKSLVLSMRACRPTQHFMATAPNQRSLEENIAYYRDGRDVPTLFECYARDAGFNDYTAQRCLNDHAPFLCIHCHEYYVGNKTAQEVSKQWYYTKTFVIEDSRVLNVFLDRGLFSQYPNSVEPFYSTSFAPRDHVRQLRIHVYLRGYKTNEDLEELSQRLRQLLHQLLHIKDPEGVRITVVFAPDQERLNEFVFWMDRLYSLGDERVTYLINRFAYGRGN